MRSRSVSSALPPAQVLEDARSRAGQGPGAEARLAALAAIDASLRLPFEQGLEEEARIFFDLLSSPQSLARRHLFFAERAAGKVSFLNEEGGGGGGGGGAAAAAGPNVMTVGVVGAGTMGGGIASAALAAGHRVVLVDAKEEALQRGRHYIARALRTLAKRGRVAPDSEAGSEPDSIMDTRLVLATDLGRLAPCEMVVEAVFEDLELKKRIFEKLAQVCGDDAVLCTNTSTLDVDAIAAASGRAAAHRVLGMHFFSPGG